MSLSSASLGTCEAVGSIGDPESCPPLADQVTGLQGEEGTREGEAQGCHPHPAPLETLHPREETLRVYLRQTEGQVGTVSHLAVTGCVM